MLSDKNLSVTSSIRLDRRLYTVGNLRLIAGLYMIKLDDGVEFIVALSDGDEVVYRVLNSHGDAIRLFETLYEAEVDTASFDGIADDLLYNNIL